MLYASPTEEEVKNAIFFFISRQSSLGPDGSDLELFISCWDIVKEDLFLGIASLIYYSCPRDGPLIA